MASSDLLALLFILSLLTGSTSLPATYSSENATTYGPHPCVYSNTTLHLTIPNDLVPPIAANHSNALQWLYLHVVPFYPRTKISVISVGNDLLGTTPNFSTILLPPIRNLHLGLRDLGIHKIAVSTTFSFINIVTTPFPPSSAHFQEPALDTVIRPLLQFLRDANSSFLVNLPIGFPLFQEHPFVFRGDLATGVRYRNLFDMMVDAVVSAMTVAGYGDISLVVTDMRSDEGTPLRKQRFFESYERSSGSESEDEGFVDFLGILALAAALQYTAFAVFGGAGTGDEDKPWETDPEAMGKVTWDPPLLCKYCQEAYGDEMAHMKKFHPDILKGKGVMIIEDKKHQCKLCKPGESRGFDNKRALEAHIKDVHRDLKKKGKM